MDKERQEVHLCPAHVPQRVLQSRHEASPRSVLTPPCQCQGQGHGQAKVVQLLLGTCSLCPDYPATLKHSLCQRLWKVQILPFRFYGWFLCLWSSVPTEDEGKFPVILMGLGRIVLVSVFCCCFLCCSRPIPLLKLLPEGKRKATLLNKLWNIYICEANPLCLAPPLILRWHFL